MVLLAALLILIAKAMKIKHSYPKTTETLTNLIDSRPSLLRLLAEKKEEQPTLVNCAADEFSLRLLEPCDCSANGFKKALAPSNGPKLPFFSAYRGGMAHIITLPNHISDSAACRRDDGTLMCEELLYKFIDLKLRLEITAFPHKGITWEASNNHITIQPKSTDPTGLHKVLITAFLPSLKDVLETAEIAYFVHPAPEDLLQNE